MTEIKFAGLSPATTDLVRKLTRVQQAEKQVVVGRTIHRLFGRSVESADRFFDALIALQIPATGATSSEVKALRGLRSRLATRTSVTVIESPDEKRQEILDLLAELWEEIDMGGEIPHAAAARLTELAFGSPHTAFYRADARKWLEEVL
jgi:hypothetical protein